MLQGDKDNDRDLLEDPSLNRKRANKRNDNNPDTKVHIIGLVSCGTLLGLEEAIIGNSDVYCTTAIVYSRDVELLRIEKEIFKNVLKSTLSW